MSDLLPRVASIPAGEFLMGSHDGDTGERPVHRVYLDSFTMGVHPVTHREYAQFVRATGYRPPAIYELPLVVTVGGVDSVAAFREAGQPYAWAGREPPPLRLDHPVTLVGWGDAVAYCRWLSQATGAIVRLPTEAEWEKASRGGLEGRRFPRGDSLDRTEANFSNVTPRPAGTTPCAIYPPNGYGLYDMAGNVWQWVRDWYDSNYYAVSPLQDPPGPKGGSLRVIRGGSWLAADERMLSCSHRHAVPPDTYWYGIGFRVVIETSNFER